VFNLRHCDDTKGGLALNSLEIIELRIHVLSEYVN